MSVSIGIMGLPKSGRTTVFNALTRDCVDTESYPQEAPHVGMARIADPRLDRLAKIFKPKKVIATEIKYLDVSASIKGMVKDTAISGEFLSQLGAVDALINVVRAFANDSIPHLEGSLDVKRDIAAMDMEIAFADLAIIERRLGRIETSLKGAKPDERHHLSHERELLLRIKMELEKEVPVRELSLTSDEAKAIAGYQFLSAKPLLTLVNIGEDQIAEAGSIERELGQCFSRPGHSVITLCAELEMELGQLDEETATGCRREFSLAESGPERVIEMSYQLLGLITFFTTASNEVRAWPIRQGASALHSASKIHTDMERGFIRAEVIGFSDLAGVGSITEGRKHGLLRLEGKSYQVQDGDVITFLFNV
jgi:GTP-binding protein YchF